MNRALTTLFMVTMALSGFLLFQVQPMMARFILPWFGGSATTWTACMLFFQTGLLLGYTYAHVFTRPISPRTQVILHTTLMAGAIAMLPITPADTWKPDTTADPTGYIFLLLLSCTALPYVMLSATSPLLQNWLSVLGSKTPSRFFSVSNFGSFLGLLSYPFIVDPLLPTTAQTLIWSWCFVIFSILMTGCGVATWMASGSAPGNRTAQTPRTGVHRPTTMAALQWFVLSALGSTLLLATTNAITSYVPVNPFLWVVPLSLYLLSFVIVFAYPTVYRPEIYGPAFATSLIIAFSVPSFLGNNYSLVRIAFELVTFGLGCMICHGELANRQPNPRYLTFFYMVMALGGAVSGIFVSLIAPQMFSDYWEFPASLLVVGLIGIVTIDQVIGGATRRTLNRRTVAIALFLIAFCAVVYRLVIDNEDVVLQTRNFYGVLKLVEEDAHSPTEHILTMEQGGEVQGEQFVEEKLRRQPTCDFGNDSGLELALNYLSRRNPTTGRKIGVVGLGAGIAAVFGQAEDRLRYYELNPAVTDMANRYFFYLRDSAAKIDIVHGDGRLSLERELSNGSQQYDLLHIDAFRGNAPPVHLMTKEAFEIYLRHLKNDGFLVVTSHSDYLNSSSLFRGLAKDLKLNVKWFGTPNADTCETKVGFAVFTRDELFFEQDVVKDRISQWPDRGSKEVLWTDQNSSLMSLLIWR